MTRPVNETERSRLGLDTPISRRDFLNGSLAAAGGALALPAGSAVADTFTGYGGVGDYARSNGNTWPVVQSAHRLRDLDEKAAQIVELLMEGMSVRSVSRVTGVRPSHSKKPMLMA